MAEMYVLSCDDDNDGCGHSVFLDKFFVANIRGTAEDATLNFACPDCGNTQGYVLSEEDKREGVGPQTRLVLITLKCEETHCESGAKVYTQASEKTDEPKKPLSEWKVQGVTCLAGHLVKVPPERLRSKIILGRQ
jgi:hypothetical protein